MTGPQDFDDGVTGRHALTLSSGSSSTPALTYDPSLSMVSIPGALYNDLGEAIGILQFPIVAAGQYTSTPLSDQLRRLTRRADRLLVELNRDERDISRVAEGLVTVETVSRHLIQEFGPAIRTVIRWNLSRMLAENDFLDWYATKYATGKSDIAASTVRTACAALHEQAERPHPVPAIAGILEGLSQVHSQDVANTVARLALRPDFSDIGRGRIDCEEIEHLDITERCRTFAETVDALFDVTEEFAPSMLERRTAEESGFGVHTLGTYTSEDHPLLGIPQRVAGEQHTSCKPTEAELAGYPTGIAWLLSKAFTDGGIGGTIYPQQNGSLSWLINPWAAASSVPDNGTYRQLWSRAVVIDYVVGRLFEQAEADCYQHDSRVDAINCPLCRLSTGTCGVRGCTHDELIKAIDSYLETLLADIGGEIDARVDTKHDVRD